MDGGGGEREVSAVLVVDHGCLEQDVELDLVSESGAARHLEAIRGICITAKERLLGRVASGPVAEVLVAAGHSSRESGFWEFCRVRNVNWLRARPGTTLSSIVFIGDTGSA